MANNFTLTDARAMHSKYPSTFEIPSSVKIKKLKKGDLVKLHFSQPKLTTERMWVTITSRKGNNFVGKLNNDPFILDMKYNQVIKFNARHIASIWD